MRMSSIKLILAPAAQTEDSIAVVWERPEKTEQIEEYQVFLDGEEAARVKETDYTFNGLKPETEYRIQVGAVMKEGAFLPKSNIVTGKTSKKAEVFDITAFGAVGDGVTMNTTAIQKAIDACTDNGMVYVPRGVFKSGALFLKSRMTFYVEEGGKLLGSERAEDYPLMTYRYEGREDLCHASLINTKTDGNRYHDITIAGSGTIDGNGNQLLKAELEGGKGKRGNVICLINTDNIYMKDITVRQSPFWCVHMIYCSHISMNRIQINSKYDENGKRYENIYNGDGFDPDSCRDVYLFHSYISSQDDCVAVKSGRDEEGREVGIPSEDIRITNCHFKSGFGVEMGSEMAGGIRNVLVQDCSFEDSFSIASVKAPRGRGAFIENVIYDNCRLVNHDRSIKSSIWFKGAIYVDYFYGEKNIDPAEKKPVGEGTSVIQNIRFSNISIETDEGYAVYLAGLAESPARNIYLENVDAYGRNGLYAENVTGLNMKAVSVKAAEGDDIRMKNVSNVIIC